MSRTALTVGTITPQGVAKSLTVGTADGHEFANSGQEVLYVENTSGTTTTFTVKAKSGAAVNNFPVSDVTVSIAGGSFALLGGYGVSVVNTSGKCQIDFESGKHANLSTQAFKFTRV